MVNCGGSYAASCSECPQGNGALWCNGECAWIGGGMYVGQCVPAVDVGLPGVPPASTDYYLIWFVLSGIIMLVYAAFYNQWVIKAPPGFPKVGSVSIVERKGLFECFKYPDTCLYVTFCLPIVAAKNYYATDVCPFWPGCIFTFLCSYSPFAPISMIFRCILSGRVQEALYGNKRDCVLDCLYAMFCFPCDVGRESLAVDEEVGADVRCCCKVTYTVPIVNEVVNAFEKTEQAVERSCSKYRFCPGGGN
mmetsp:Transcript_74955/g.194917  ORF Transcript_74955/g.194917 Transcript_74955/m.194917 type:complete len:249 (+) Transcript_74955:113-859(+)